MRSTYLFIILFQVLFSTHVEALDQPAQPTKKETSKSTNKSTISTKPKKSDDISAITDAELIDTAKNELDAPALGGVIAPLDSPDSGIVSTAEAIQREEKEIYAEAEFEIGAQEYKPSGMKNSSNRETYTLIGVDQKPMVLLNARKWIFRDGLRWMVPWRLGMSGGTGITSNKVTIKTSSGKSYDNARLNSVLLGIGPDLEVFYKIFGFGVGAKVGKVIFVQSTPNPYLNKSEDSNYWEYSGSFRIQPTKSFYIKVAYSKRAGLGSADGIQVQENSSAAFLGFGM